MKKHLPLEIVSDIVMMQVPTYPFIKEMKEWFEDPFVQFLRNDYFIVWMNTRFRCDRCGVKCTDLCYYKHHMYFCRNCFLFFINI